MRRCEDVLAGLFMQALIGASRCWCSVEIVKRGFAGIFYERSESIIRSDDVHDETF